MAYFGLRIPHPADREPMKTDIYKTKPWKSATEYYEQAMKHQLFGDELERHLKSLNKKSSIPEPKLTP